MKLSSACWGTQARVPASDIPTENSGLYHTASGVIFLRDYRVAGGFFMIFREEQKVCYNSVMTDTHIALYRKYRPADWGEVLGQEHVISVLKEAVKNNAHAHAYLFSGSRGTGKTSIARILAGKLGVTASDIYEIDAASNRGIDDVRELREAVHALPLESPYKVYIVDEVHMLTKEAFNALLKTLEEPPQHVIFILATTEPHKLPDTIISRCETHAFKKPTHTILKKMIADTAKKEGVPLDAASADLIAMLGDGSYRDAHSILQKVLSFGQGKELTRQDVEVMTGAPPSELVNDVVCAVAESDTGKGLDALRQAGEQNIDMELFAKLILHKLRAILLLRFAPDMKATLAENFTDTDLQFLEKQAKKAKTVNSKTLEHFIVGMQQVRYAAITQLPLELALINSINTDQKDTSNERT